MINMYVCVMPSFLPKKPNIFVCGFFVKKCSKKHQKKTNKKKLNKNHRFPLIPSQAYIPH